MTASPAREDHSAAERRVITRRGIVGAGVAAPFVLSSCGPAAPSAKTIGMASTGGVYNDILRRVWIDDFEKKTGYRVNLSSNMSMAQAKLQTETDRPQWDVVELTGPWYELAVRQKLLLPLDGSIINLKAFPPEFVTPYGVKYALFNNCIAWDPRVIPDSLQPGGWADFWDLKTRPGKRSLDGGGDGAQTLEIALIADGVAPDKLYPLDIERGFRSLDRLGRDNVIWAQSFPEPIQRLMSQEVSLATTWPYRVTSANKAGAHIGYNFNQCGVGGDWLGVVKTTRDPGGAFRLINAIISNTQACGEFTRLTHYGTPNLDSLKLIPKADADMAPTGPILAPKLYHRDDAWLADHMEAINTRFKQWQLGIKT